MFSCGKKFTWNTFEPQVQICKTGMLDCQNFDLFPVTWSANIWSSGYWSATIWSSGFWSATIWSSIFWVVCVHSSCFLYCFCLSRCNSFLVWMVCCSMRFSLPMSHVMHMFFHHFRNVLSWICKQHGLHWAMSDWVTDSRFLLFTNGDECHIHSDWKCILTGCT